MSPATRTTYFRLYAAACAAQGWDPRDNARRRDTTLYCMREIGAGEIDSITGLNHHQVTALFTFLRFLTGAGGRETTLLWDKCKEDYVSFNRLRHAEHFRRAAGYKKGGKLNRERFGLNFPEEEIAEHTLSAKEVDQYLITNANRARAKDPDAAPPPSRRRPAAHRSYPASPSYRPSEVSSVNPF
jgi:hypothetical protein